MIRFICCLVVWLRNSYLHASQSSVHRRFLKIDECTDQMILYLKVQVVPKSAEPSDLQDIPPAPSPSSQAPPAATVPVAPSPNTTTPVETPPPYHEIYPAPTSPPGPTSPQSFPGPLEDSASSPSTQTPHSPSIQLDPPSPQNSSEPSASAGPSDPKHASAGRTKVEDAGPLPSKMRTFQD